MSGSDLETDLSDDLLDDFGLDDDIDALSSFDDPPSPAVHESPVTAGGLSLFPEPSDNARRRSSAAVDPEDLLATKPAADSISPFGNLLAASSNAGFGNIFAQLASPRPKDLSPTDPAVEVPSVVLNDALEAPVPDNAEDAGTDPAPSDDKGLPPLQDLRSQHDHFMLAAAKVLAACGHAAHLCDVADFTLPAGAPTASDEEEGPTTEEDLSEVLRGAQRAADRVKALCRDDVDLTARWFTLICSKAPAAAEAGPMDGVSLDGSIHTEPEEDEEARAAAGTSVIPAEESLATAVAVTRQALLCAPTADEQAAVAMRGSLQRTVPVEGTGAEQAAIAFCLKVRAVAGQLAGLAVELCFVCAQSTIVPVAFVDGRDGPALDDDPTELHLPRPAFLPALEHVATLGLQMPAFFALRLAVLVHPPDAVEAVCRPILLRSAAYSHSNVEAALMAVAEQALTDGLRDPERWVAPMVHAFAALLDTCTELLHAEIDRVERARSELAKGRSLRSASAKAMEVKVPKTVDLVDLILDVLTHIVSRGAGKAFLRGTLVSPPTSGRSSDTAAPKRDIAATLFAGGVDESRDRPLGATTEAGGLDVCLRGLHMLRLKRRLQLLGAGSEAATRALMSPGSRQSGADGHAGPGEEQATATVQRLLKLVTPTFLFGAALDAAGPEPDLADSTRPPPSPLGDSNVELVISDSSAGPLGTGSVQGEGDERDEKDEREGEGTGTGESEAPFSDPDGPKEVGLAALRKDSEKSEAAVTITTPDDRRISQPFASTRSSVSEAPLTPQAQRLQRLSRLLGADDATTLLRLVNDALVYFVLDDAQECARLRSDAGAVALQCLTAAPNSPTTAAALDVFHGAVAALLSVRPVLDECSAILYILSSLQARAHFETALFDSRALQTMSRAFTAVFDVVQGWVLPSRAYASQQTHDGATTLRKAAQTGGAAAQAVTGATKDRVVQFDRVMDNVGRCVKMLHRCALPFQCIMGAFATADYVASATAAAAPDMSQTPTTAAIPPPIESPPERFNSLFKAFDTGPRPEAAAPPSPAFLEPTAMGRRASRLSSRRSSLQLGSLERHEEVRVLLHLTELSIGGGRRFSDSTLAQGGEEWAGRGGGAADERRSAKVGTRGLLSLLRFLVFLDLAADLESRLAVSAGGRRGTVRGADALAAVPLDNARWAFGAVNFLNQDDAARRVLVDAGIVETLCACLDPPAATLLCRDPEAGPAAPDTPEKGRSGSTSRLERRASMLAQPDTAAGRKAEALAGAMVTGAVQTALHEAYAAKVLSVVGGGETSPLLALAMRGSAAGADGYAPPVPAILRAAVSIPLRPLDDASVRRAEGDDGRNPFAAVLAPKLALPAKDFVKPALGIMAACARHLFSAGNAMFQAGLDCADGQEGTLVPFARRASTFFALLASVLCRALTPSLRVCAVLCAKEFVSRASVLYSAHGVGTDAGPAAHVATAAPPVLAEKPESLQRVLSEGSVSPVELCDTARELRLPDISIPVLTVRGSVSSSRSGNDDAEHSFGGGIALDGEDAVLQRPTSLVIRRHSLKPDDAPAAEVAFALAGIPGCVPPPPPPKAKEAALRLSSSLDQSPPAVSRSSSQPSLLRKGTAPPQHGPPTPEPTEPGARDSKDEVSFASPFAEIRRVDSLSGLQPRRLSQGTSHGSAAALFSLHDASASGSAAGSTAPSVARVAASRLAVDCVAVEALLAALSDVLDRAQIDVGPLLFSVANPTRRQSVVLSRRPSLGFGARRASAGLSASATAVQEPAVAAMSALTVAALFKLPLAAVVFQPTGGHGGHIIGPRGSLVPVLKASLARVAAWEYSALDAATRVAAMVGQAVKQLDDDPNLDKDKDVKDREAPRRSLAPDTPGQDPFAIPRRRSMQGVGFLQAFGRRSSVAGVAHASTATVVGSSRRALTSATLSVGFVIAVVADAAEAAAGVAGSEQEVLRKLLEEMRLNYAEDTAVMAAIKSAAQLDGRRRTVHAFRTRDAGGTAGAPQGVLSRQDQQLCAAQYQRLLQVRQDQRQFERDVHAMEGSATVEDEAVAEKVSAAVAAPLRTFLLSEEESGRRAVEGHEEDAAETLRHRFAAGRDAIAAAAAEGERRRAEQSEMRALVEAATAAAAAAAAESIGRQLAEERRVWEEERRAAEAREAERQSAVEAATRRAEAAELDAKAAAVAREAAVAAAHEAARIAREERDAERAAEQQRQQEREAARDAREAERYAAEREAREREARDREAREAAARAREAHERAAREQEWREREARLTKDLDVQASPERPATAPAPPPEQEAAPVVSLASFGLDGGIFSQLASVVLPQRRALLEIEEHDGRRALAAEEADTRPVLEHPGADATLATPPDPEHLVRHLLAVVEETRAAVRSLERQRSQSLPGPAPAPAPLDVHRCQSAGPHLTDAQLPGGPEAPDPDGDGIADDDGSSVGGSTADHFSPLPQPPAAPQPPPGPEVRYHWGAEQLRPRPPSAGRPSSARRPASRPTSARLALVPRPPPRDLPEERPVTAAGAAVPKEEEEGLTEQLTITALCDDIAAAADGPDPLMDSRGDDRDEATAPLDAAAAGGPPRHTSHFAAPLPGRGRLLAVDLGQHYVGDAGLRAGLGDTLGGLRYLHTLCLPHNGITARGLPLLLEALWGSEHLAVLDLSGNKGITPAAGRPLVKFVQHRPSLRELRVGGTQLFIATRRILDGILTDRCLHSPRPAASD